MLSRRLLIFAGSVCLILVLAVLPFMTACPAPAEEEEELPEIHWKWQCAYGAGDHEADISVPERIAIIEELTDGKFTIERFYGGEIVPPDEILTGVGEGLCEIAEGPPSYWVGLDPAFDLCQGLPMTQRNPPGDAWAFQNGSEWSEIVREMFAEYGCHYVGWHTYGPYPILCSRVPVRSIEDWEGVKVRISGYSAELFEAMGASTTYIPGSEIYGALMLGTIDVGTWTAECVEDMHFGEVMDYLIMPPFLPNFGGVTIVNEEAWASLPDKYQEAIEKSERIAHLHAVEFWNDQMEKDLTTFAEKYGYEVIWLPEEDVEEMSRLALETVWTKWAQKSPRCAKGIELVKDWYGIE